MPKDAAARFLFIGDVVGQCGRQALLSALPSLRNLYDPTFVVVNGENAAGGVGITPKVADQLFAAGVDVITLGNHAYHRKEILPYLDTQERIVRPANFLSSHPGKGWCIVEAGGVKLAVVNLLGNLHLQPAYPAFEQAAKALAAVADADHVLVDFHAEATSEKVALGWYLDGRVTAVVGTHTHVQTADARILPGGTAYITDAGMTGSRFSVIGFDRDQALRRLTTLLPGPLEPASEEPWVMGVAIGADRRRRASWIEPIAVPSSPAGPSSAQSEVA